MNARAQADVAPAHTVELDDEVDVRAYRWTDWARFAPVWSSVHAQSRDPSFFLGERWTAAWVEIFGPVLDPQILLFRNGGEPIGICLLGTQRRRHGPVPVTRLYLNTTGESQSDATCIEYNDLVCRPGWERRVALALARHLRKRSWDELVLDGFRPGPGLESLRDALAPRRCEESVRSSRYIDLEDLRRRGVSYEQVLSGNTRRQIRRSNELYQGKGGAVVIECASSPQEALAMLGELADLHQRSWTARGKPGVFSSELFSAFHRRLIEAAFPCGEIQLLRISGCGKTIGVLYNFLYQGRVYFYQSGFDYAADNRLKPGLVSHARAVQFCLERGWREYDFLAGDAQYKRSLATGDRPLTWVVLQRGTVAMKAVRFLRRMKAAYEQMASKKRTAPVSSRGPTPEVPD